jgi:hypothetical protein
VDRPRESCEILSSHGSECENVLWDVGPCSLVEIGHRFGDAYNLHHGLITLMMEAVGISETSVNLYYTAQHTRRESVTFDEKFLLSFVHPECFGPFLWSFRVSFEFLFVNFITLAVFWISVSLFNGHVSVVHFSNRHQITCFKVTAECALG